MTGPVRLALHASGELSRRVDALRAVPCPPVDCQLSTVNPSPGTPCRVAAAFPHFGEEACLVGRGGSGTVFLQGCNLGCVFCQNRDLRDGAGGRECDPDALADLFLALQAAGCENLNWVTPSHVAADLVDALDRATGRGLRLPVVWNSSGYDPVAALRALDGVVDVYLPDLKTLDPARAAAWMGAADYPDVARAAIAEMVRQAGDLAVDGRGVATRGVLVRHLVMPGATDDARAVMAFLASLGPLTVHVMDQYRPLGDAHRIPGLGRRPTDDEIAAARTAAREAGLRLL